MAINQDLGEALGWDDRVKAVDSEFVLLAPGTYDYRVKAFERGWFNGSEKMCPCAMAKMTLSVADPASGSMVDVFCNLMLNRKVLFRITQFFKSCGLLSPDTKDGDEFDLSLFPKSVGRTGRVKIKNRTYNGRTYNDVDSFIKPEAGAAQQQSWGGGGF